MIHLEKHTVEEIIQLTFKGFDFQEISVILAVNEELVDQVICQTAKPAV